MISNDPKVPQSTASPTGTEPMPSVRSFSRDELKRPIEVLSGGNTTTSDPSAKDQVPPGGPTPYTGA
jgi:hypothetical protein